MPGMRVPFQPLNVPGALLPTAWWNPSVYFTWSWRSTCAILSFNKNITHLTIYAVYRKYGSESVSIVPFIAGVPSIYTTNLEIARQVVPGLHKTGFRKPRYSARVLLWVASRLLLIQVEKCSVGYGAWTFCQLKGRPGENIATSLDLLSTTTCKSNSCCTFCATHLKKNRYQRVWVETIDIYRQMISTEGWTSKTTIHVPVVQKLTFKVYSFS